MVNQFFLSDNGSDNGPTEAQALLGSKAPDPARTATFRRMLAVT